MKKKEEIDEWIDQLLNEKIHDAIEIEKVSNLF